MKWTYEDALTYVCRSGSLCVGSSPSCPRGQASRFNGVAILAQPEGLFGWWCQGMQLLGYNLQTVSVSSSAHIGSPSNPYAPQWRDRL